MKKNDTYQSYIKSPYKSIKLSTYFDSYDHFFSKYRNQNITFVEIGVLGGVSLFMWRDYFGPKARIIGVDLNPNAKKWEKSGFEIYIGSQSDINFWETFTKDVGLIDVVLDDGGHTYEQQIITTECLLPSMNDGGIIVVEDTHTSYMEGFGPKKKSFIEYTKMLIDKLNMRFGEFCGSESERRFWSIEVVESMVALKINKKASNLKSELINNGGMDDLAQDFRYADNPSIEGFNKIVSFFKFMRKIPFAKFLAISLRNYLGNRKFAAKKYFK
ncbi:class I SAM-dependent methyltransferase [Amylibacter sp.]|nr:class I SAM-dependent methyltransferase [Amylibacter sp.]